MSVHYRAQILRLFLALPATAAAQSLPTYALIPVSSPQALADRGPVFYAITPSGHRESIDAGHTIALKRRISLQLDRVSIPTALHAIELQTDLRFTYDPAVLPSDATVSLHAEDIAVAAALTQVLLDASVDIELAPTGLVSLRTRPHAPQVVQQSTGSITGRAKDSKSGAPLRGITIVVNNTRFGATTGDSGQFTINSVPIGAYTVTARTIGYAAAHQSITVVADHPVVATFALARSANQLEQVIVTGTIIPTEVKAIPTPVSVISDSAIENEHPRTLMELIRETVPSVVAWDAPADPEETFISVRGTADLSGNSSVKMYIDGLEVSNSDYAAVDPASVDHVEMIRGPEAATIYGSDAIGGVMQVFTKHGDSTDAQPQINLGTAFGAAQSPYAGYSGALRQEYQASIYGGTSAASYNFGGSYTSMGNWTPEGAYSTPSGYGGVHLNEGLLAIDLSARLYEQRTDDASNPALAKVWPSEYSKPFYYHYQFSEQTYGTHITYTLLPQWQHQLTLGTDISSIEQHETQPRLTSPADTALFILYNNAPRTSIAYNTNYRLHLTNSLSANITAGADHYTLDGNEYLTFGALNTSGGISTEPSGPPQATRNVVQDNGYFGQLQVNIADALFITTGVRAEQNSSFGSSLGTPVLPRYGVSYVHAIGTTSIKLRASYGQAILPPTPGEAQETVYANNIQLANPFLGPERQAGWDAGVDIAATQVGALSVTYYDQIANELIQSVFLGGVNQDLQFQNIGQVRNSGLEVDGSLSPVSNLMLRGQYAYTRSRVDGLGSDYTGSLRVGDQVYLVPYNTAGGSATYTPLTHTQITAGVTYVGSWRYYNLLAEFACYGGTGPCAANTRAYLAPYHSFAKVNLSVTQGLTHQLSAFLSIDNLADTEVSEGYNSQPTLGRVTKAGLRLHVQ